MLERVNHRKIEGLSLFDTQQLVVSVSLVQESQNSAKCKHNMWGRNHKDVGQKRHRMERDLIEHVTPLYQHKKSCDFSVDTMLANEAFPG